MTIGDLPPEVPSQVLEHGLEPYLDFDKSVPSKRKDFLSSTCLISVQWRDIAYQIPQLWSLVAVDVDGGLSAPERAYQAQTRQLKRAKSAPLDIILSRSVRRYPWDPEPDRPEFWAFWPLLTERSEQWRSICIDKIKIQSMHEMHILFPTSLPSLIEARTKVDAHYTFTPFVSALRLRFFNLRSGYLPFTSGESLVHLTNKLHLNQAIPLLPTCTILRTFHLDKASVHVPWPTELVTLPSLEHFSIKGSDFMSLCRINAIRKTAKR